jgi:hypothetical protein
MKKKQRKDELQEGENRQFLLLQKCSYEKGDC